jgi:hypothetical protein
MKSYKGSQFAIVKDEFIQDNMECEHALCERFHQKGCPPIRVVQWLIIDLKTNDRFGRGEVYELRRDAVEVLDNYLANQ